MATPTDREVLREENDRLTIEVLCLTARVEAAEAERDAAVDALLVAAGHSSSVSRLRESVSRVRSVRHANGGS